jgi:DNA-binding NarL/FixJ family response regulator
MSAGQDTENRTVSVVIADDSYVMREFLTTILSGADDIDVLAVCVNGKELMSAVESWTPDVVVTDIRMPPSGTDEGIQIAQQLRETHPEIGVVVLSQFTDPVYGLALLDDGSDGRLTGNCSDLSTGDCPCEPRRAASNAWRVEPSSP